MERAVAAALRDGDNNMASSFDPVPNSPPVMPEREDTPEKRGPPPPKGPFVEAYPPECAAGARLRPGRTAFEEIRDAQLEHDLPPYAPFASLDEWEHLRWLVTSGASQSKIDEYLKMKSVSVMFRAKSQTLPVVGSRDGATLPQQDKLLSLCRSAPTRPRLVVPHLVC